MESEPARGKVPKRWPGFRIYLRRESRLRWRIQVLEDKAQEISQIHPSEYTRRSRAAHSLHVRYQVLEAEITRYGLGIERNCEICYPSESTWLPIKLHQLLLDKLLEIRKDAVTLAFQQLIEISDVVVRGDAWLYLHDEIRHVEDHAKKSKALVFKSKPIHQMDCMVRDQFSHNFWLGLMDLYTTKVLWKLSEDMDIPKIAERDYWRRCEEQEAGRGEKM